MLGEVVGNTSTRSKRGFFDIAYGNFLPVVIVRESARFEDMKSSGDSSTRPIALADLVPRVDLGLARPCAS